MARKPDSEMDRARIHYAAAHTTASRAMENAAIALLRKHPKLLGFCAAMGSASFEFVDRYGNKRFDPDDFPMYLRAPVRRWEDEYLIPFNDMFNGSFDPIKVTRNGDGLLIERDW